MQQARTPTQRPKKEISRRRLLTLAHLNGDRPWSGLPARTFSLKEKPTFGHNCPVPKLTGECSIDLTVLDVGRSALWYADLLGTDTGREFRSDDGHLMHVVLNHPSGLTLGLIQHEDHSSSKFDERSVGLDHLEFIVPDVEDVYKWAKRLDELEILHSGVKELGHTAGVMVTFRDPDNIQLEFYALKPQAQS